MRALSRFRCLLILSALFCAVPQTAAENLSIEAVRGKHYRLRKVHGPWMILAASLRDVPEERRLSEGKGMSAQEAADELVFELRQLGIPAYTYSTDDVLGQVRTTDRRTGEARDRSFVAQQGRIVVMAGNYKSAADKTAQQTLKAVKKLKPQFLGERKNGGIFRPTPGRPGPLSGAFLTVNPLLSHEEVQRTRRDPLIMKLNSDMKYGLLGNPGRYSLAIASFHGKTMTQVSTKKFDALASRFDSKLDDSLDSAARSAWQLCEAMRMARQLGYDRDFQTWVYHDRHHSIVTVGSFDSPHDPRIQQYVRLFGGKQVTDPNTGRTVLSGEVFTVPRVPQNGQGPEYSWVFDPQPQLMERRFDAWDVYQPGGA